jgi:hypothetical protein
MDSQRYMLLGAGLIILAGGGLLCAAILRQSSRTRRGIDLDSGPLRDWRASLWGFVWGGISFLLVGVAGQLADQTLPRWLVLAIAAAAMIGGSALARSADRSRS